MKHNSSSDVGLEVLFMYIMSMYAFVKLAVRNYCPKNILGLVSVNDVKIDWMRK
jgi:hypothetical protein